MAMTTTTTADTNADANARSSSSSCCSSSGAMAGGGEYRTSKDVRGTGVGCVSGKQRPSNGREDDCGGILPIAGKCGGDPDEAALPPLLPPFPPAR